MQRLIHKLLPTFALFFLFATQINANILTNRNISIGDSLFEHKDYQGAILYYKLAFQGDHVFSQQVLSRMAMIEEASDHYVMTLYYLNTMYYYYPDTRVIQKMEDMGEKYHLTGYNFNDLEYLISVYKEYYYYIIFSLTGIGIPFIIYLFFRIRRKEPLGIRPLIFLVILGTVFYLNNFDITPSMGIIQAESELMEGPSAGADIIELTDPGHRVRIIGKQDIWYKIAWKDKTLFIRDIYLLPVGNQEL